MRKCLVSPALTRRFRATLSRGGFAHKVPGEVNSPPWQRRGGRDIKKNFAKPPSMERTGWFVQLAINRWLERTAPSAPAKEASRHLLDGRSHPAFTKAGN
jgi:hypothetical protein